MYKDRINTIIKTIDVIDDNLNSDSDAIKYHIEEKLGYTYGYISELFKGELGITTHDYIMSRKGIDIKNDVNQIKSKLQNQLYMVESFDCRIIKKKRVKGEEIFIEIDYNELFLVMADYPIMIFPKNKYIDNLLSQIDYVCK